MSRKAGYQAKLTTPEEAAGVVKSGDLVYIPAPPHPQVLIQALADRRDELHDVKVCIDSHVFDPGWLQPGWGDSFYIVTEQFLGLGIDAYNDHHIDYSPLLNTTRIPSLMAKGVPKNPSTLFSSWSRPPTPTASAASATLPGTRPSWQNSPR